MRLSALLLAFAVLVGGGMQEGKKEEKKEEKKKEQVDPFADPKEEMFKRAERLDKEKRFEDLKAASAELVDVSKNMSDEITKGNKDVISAKLWRDLDRAEKLLKTMKEKAK